LIRAFIGSPDKQISAIGVTTPTRRSLATVAPVEGIAVKTLSRNGLANALESPIRKIEL
jgi:hypothetical protein